MNTYLYPWYDDNDCQIKKVTARSYEECLDKIQEMYYNKFEDLSDTASFDDFLDEIWNKHGIFIGDIHELDEFE